MTQTARLCLLAALVLAPPAPSNSADSIERMVVFDRYADSASNAELVRRLLSPLAARVLRRDFARSGKALADQPIDLSKERFIVRAPGAAPPGGYGVLVFIPPWPEAKLPPGWGPVLDRRGMIFVSAANSGNEASVVGRRIPLALLALENVRRRYAIDLDRVFVAGFSGGSRVALKVALAYPDLFRGALLNAGSDPIGDGETPLPPKPLFERFRTSSRIVFVTGRRDDEHLAMDMSGEASLRAWCVANVTVRTSPLTAHDPAGPAALGQALDALEAPARQDQPACRARVEAELDKRLAEIDAIIAAGKQAAALDLLTRVDRRFGGLAAPRSEALANKLDGASPT